MLHGLIPTTLLFYKKPRFLVHTWKIVKFLENSQFKASSFLCCFVGQIIFKSMKTTRSLQNCHAIKKKRVGNTEHFWQRYYRAVFIIISQQKSFYFQIWRIKFFSMFLIFLTNFRVSRKKPGFLFKKMCIVPLKVSYRPVEMKKIIGEGGVCWEFIKKC